MVASPEVETRWLAFCPKDRAPHAIVFGQFPGDSASLVFCPKDLAPHAIVFGQFPGRRAHSATAFSWIFRAPGGVTPQPVDILTPTGLIIRAERANPLELLH